MKNVKRFAKVKRGFVYDKMKKWMLVIKGRNHLLLHYNEELEQYKDLPRIPNKIIKEIKKLKLGVHKR